MKPSKAPLILALGLAFFTAATAQALSPRYCPAVAPQAAVLSSDGQFGVRFGSGSADGFQTGFSTFRPIESSDYCFGGAVKKMMEDTCLALLGREDEPVTSQPAIKQPVAQQPPPGPACKNASRRIKDLERRNLRLRKRVQYLDSLRGK